MTAGKSRNTSVKPPAYPGVVASAQSGKRLVATDETVPAACEQLFRSGEAITEANVRRIIGGGTRMVIYRLIREWEEEHRRKYLEMEAVTAGDAKAPPGVPEELWEAMKPVWDTLLSRAQKEAETAIDGERRALAEERQALGDEREQVQAMDAAWKEEKTAWSDQISDLQTRNSGLADEIQSLRHTISGLQQDAVRLASERDVEARRANDLQEGLAAAEKRHEGDQTRWAGQIDTARQEAARVSQELGRQVEGLQRRERELASTVQDLQLKAERLATRNAALEAADMRSQAEISRLAAALKTKTPAKSGSASAANKSRSKK